MIISAALDQEAMEREFHAAIAAERKADRVGAAMFVRACRDDDPELLLNAVDFLNDNTIDGWRLAMRGVGRLPRVSEAIKAAFLPVWIEAKHMPLVVGHRPTMARALHILMPPIPLDASLRLYRGTSALERSRRLYGFSWTTHLDIARRFAEQARLGSEGAVVLETLAAPGTIHLRREEEGYYDEGEIVVDPYRLGKVQVLTRLSSSRDLESQS